MQMEIISCFGLDQGMRAPTQAGFKLLMLLDCYRYRRISPPYRGEIVNWTVIQWRYCNWTFYPKAYDNRFD